MQLGKSNQRLSQQLLSLQSQVEALSLQSLSPLSPPGATEITYRRSTLISYSRRSSRSFVQQEGDSDLSSTLFVKTPINSEGEVARASALSAAFEKVAQGESALSLNCSP